MSERERHTPAAGAPLPADAPPRPPASSPEPSLWEAWYTRATPLQQQEMLALAAHQGLVYRHQLPPVNGASPAGSRPLLPTLLSSSTQRLPIPPLLPFEPLDSALDSRQREAVARALVSPDVCLIQGYPGTGKSRVAGEIIVQAVQRGLRVLLLAPTTAAIDRILERLTGQPDLCPLRCLGPAETPASLSPCIRRLTSAERARLFEQETVAAARAKLHQCRQEQQALSHLQNQRAALLRLARQHEEALARRQPLLEQRDRLLQAVQNEATATHSEGASDFQKAWQACARAYHDEKERIEGQRAVWQAERETIRGKQEQLARELDQVRPLRDARQSRRWWTGAWWRAVLGGNPEGRFQDLEGRQADLQSALARLDEELAGCARRLQQAESDSQTQTQHLIAAEVARRQALLDEQLAQLDEQQQAARQQWQALAVSGAPPLPEAMTPAAVEQACAHWDRLREQGEHETDAAEKWLAAVEETAAHLPERLGTWANLVAATTAAVLAGALPSSTAAEGFDLVVLDEAHQVTESELTGVARHARRWVLLGEPPPEEENRGETSSRALRPAALRPGFFQRLWQHLHADPRRLPCSWQERQGRLVCRLFAVPPEQEPFLELEPLADRPDIELRILAAPRQQPRLAEVIFPTGTSIAEAKALLYRELEELTVQAAGPCLHWSETPSHILAELGLSPPADATCARLEDGLSEVVGCKRPSDEAASRDACWYTWRLEFDRQAGWDRERAESWLRDRLALRDLRRTALLSTPYRGHPGLVRFLSDLLFAGACEPAAQAPSPANDTAPPAVELIPVPPLAADSRPPQQDASHPASSRPRLRGVKAGAGLEMDLGETRPLEHLPADLRSQLPSKGLVNYLEALAVVKKLEELAGDPELRAAACHWQQSNLLHPLPAGRNGSDRQPAACAAAMPVVAVMAPYPAQVELIRLLVRRSAVLASAGLPLEIGLPSDFQQRECLLALVSLTRSHSHRAVCYGDSPEVLIQALTRPAGRLLLFGDPATLIRRSQWQGALDHLDERSAQRERRLLARLVRYLQGRGQHPRAFRVQEGCGV